jgi:hypothetical protein
MFMTVANMTRARGARRTCSLHSELYKAGKGFNNLTQRSELQVQLELELELQYYMYFGEDSSACSSDGRGL